MPSASPASADGVAVGGDWRPGARLDMLRERAALNADIRAFFRARGVLEVETPLLCSATALDLHLESFRVDGRYLQTSPEFAMKRLLAAGSGAVFQLCKAFRRGDIGARHNPEFSLLEWYRPGYALADLADEIEALLPATAHPATAGMAANAVLSAPCQRTTYRALFEARYGCNPHRAELASLQALAVRETSIGDASALDIPACLDLLFSVGIEPGLGQVAPQFVFEYPLAQAALAQAVRNSDGDLVAARCELYVRGMELANGYLELLDAGEQRRRFVADNAARRAAGLPEIALDERFLAALAHGMPACSGVALGVDRLLMLRTGAATIDDVLAFSAGRC